MHIRSVLLAVGLMFVALQANNSHAQLQAPVQKGDIMIDPYYGFPNFGKTFAQWGANQANSGNFWSNLFDNVEETVNTYLSEYTSESITLNGDVGIGVSGLGPMGGRAEYVLFDGFSVGFDFIYNSTWADFSVDSLDISGNTLETFNVRYTMHRMRGIVRANYHFVRKNWFDMYCALGVGFNSRIHKIESNIFDWDFSQAYTGAFPLAGRTAIGVKFYPIKYVGLGLEVGLGGPLVSGGLSFRFNPLNEFGSGNGAGRMNYLKPGF